jgi:hypothetical protein
MKNKLYVKLTILVAAVGLSLMLLALNLVWLSWQAAPPVHADPGIRYVATTGTDSGDCTDSANPCGTVQYAVDQAQADDEIRVAAGVYTGVQVRTGMTQVVYITKTVTIGGGYTTTNWTTPDPDANPTTLDAEGLGRVMVISGTIIPTIEGLRITRGDATGLGGGPSGQDTGGGLYVYGSAVLTETLVLTNTAQRGGGLYQHDAAGWVDVTGGRFEGNVANGTVSYDGGGGLYVNGSATLSATQVVSNAAARYGGGLFVYDSAVLSGTEVVSNTALYSGGGLYQRSSSGRVDVIGGRFEGNVAQYNGGGLFVAGSATVTGTQVVSNTAGYRGGGLHESSSNGQVDVTGGRFERNVATQYDGGGLYIYGSAALTGTQVLSNTAQRCGGGLYQDYSDGQVNVTGSCFMGNLANGTGTSDGGGGLYVESDAVLSDTQVVSNTAQVRGGGLYQDGDDRRVDVTGGRFERNVATTSSGGGLFVHHEGSAVLSGTQVISNSAGYLGGGLFGRVEVTDGRFEGNAASQHGGGLWAYSPVLTGTQVVSNTAGSRGGGLYSAGSPTLIGAEVVSNTAGSAGGGLYQSNISSRVDATGGRFERNVASIGGGLYVDGGATLSGTLVVSNTAGIGGGLYQYGGRVDVTGGRFAGNVANGTGSNDGGGGLYIRGSAALTGTQVISNTAEAYGGGLYRYGTSGQVDVIGGRFEGNVTTQYDGGGLYSRSNVVLSGTLVISNTAGQYGGGLYQDGDDRRVDVIGGRFEGNVTTQYDGGGLYIEGSAALTETQVVSNTATRSGGGLYHSNTDERVDVIGGRFEGNVVQYNGGGLFVGGSAVLSGTQVISNTAGSNGGGLYMYRGDVIGGRFEGNTVNVTSNYGGGGLYILYSATLTGTEVVSNTARWGGGLYVRESAVLNEVQVVSNTGTFGGGLCQYDTDERVDVIGGRFERNVATSSGGGLYVLGSAVLTGTEVVSNTATYGGGLYVSGSATLSGTQVIAIPPNNPAAG